MPDLLTRLTLADWLNICSAIAAFIAAVFWFVSVFGKLPQLSSYYGKTPPTDPFYKAVIFGAKMNRRAAFAAGSSAIFTVFANIAAIVAKKT
ncbi:hypothetical protein LGH83_04530 [Lichenihabitans sp. PAMC28606]|uniref:hypothetical protein n=1 Tax=Lichenihabitans sp. PAMC28606 TaxID=2880932 RepID=UPI001D0BC875|nr:hypothetical protein [Lichenihabitans sp. PAMC28606]UDL95493.1 hypothetical protein LGH83_04530 [Lichenihabitans sp. PAMC28606]